MLPDMSRILRLDAAANLAGAVAVAAAASVLAQPLGLDAAWPLYVLAAIMAVYGLDQWVTAPDPGTAAVVAFVVVDVLFAAGVIGWALADPGGAETWARWVAGGLGELVLAVGAAKAVTWRRRTRRTEVGATTAGAQA